MRPPSKDVGVATKKKPETQGSRTPTRKKKTNNEKASQQGGEEQPNNRGRTREKLHRGREKKQGEAKKKTQVSARKANRQRGKKLPLSTPLCQREKKVFTKKKKRSRINCAEPETGEKRGGGQGGTKCHCGPRKNHSLEDGVQRERDQNQDVSKGGGGGNVKQKIKEGKKKGARGSIFRKGKKERGRRRSAAGGKAVLQQKRGPRQRSSRGEGGGTPVPTKRRGGEKSI